MYFLTTITDKLPPVKLCKNCVHFDSKTLQCKYFVKKSLIDGSYKNKDGSIMHPYATIIRSKEDYCGIGAKYYEQFNRSP